MRKGKENPTTTSSGNYIYATNPTPDIEPDADDDYAGKNGKFPKNYFYDGLIGYATDDLKKQIETLTTKSSNNQKDIIDLVLIVVSSLIIIASFTYIIFI